MTALPILHHPEDGWIKHHGQRCPVPEDAIVRFQFACGHLSKERVAGNFRWSRRSEPFDIVAYRIISMPEAQG